MNDYKLFQHKHWFNWASCPWLRLHLCAKNKYLLNEVFFVNWSPIITGYYDMGNFHLRVILIYITCSPASRSIKRPALIDYVVIVVLEQWASKNKIVWNPNIKDNDLIKSHDQLRILLVDNQIHHLHLIRQINYDKSISFVNEIHPVRECTRRYFQ